MGEPGDGGAAAVPINSAEVAGVVSTWRGAVRGAIGEEDEPSTGSSAAVGVGSTAVLLPA
jgi:hypothetical protein